MRGLVASSLLLVVVGCGGAPGETGVLSEGLMMCPTVTVEGIDVYVGDGVIDWLKVKGANTPPRLFGIIKATQGDYNTQSTFATNWAAAKAAGVVRGPYHYFDATVDGVAQANHFLAVLNQAGGLSPGDLPPMLDLECPTDPSQTAPNLCLGNNKSGWAPTATLNTRIFDWLNTVEAATGRKPINSDGPIEARSSLNVMSSGFLSALRR